MKKYNYEKIDKLLQPVMAMMREEFPNDCKLIIDGNYSQIIFEHVYLSFQNDEMKKIIGKTNLGEALSNLANMFPAVTSEDSDNNAKKGDKKTNEQPESR